MALMPATATAGQFAAGDTSVGFGPGSAAHPTPVAGDHAGCCRVGRTDRSQRGTDCPDDGRGAQTDTGRVDSPLQTV